MKLSRNLILTFILILICYPVFSGNFSPNQTLFLKTNNYYTHSLQSNALFNEGISSFSGGLQMNNRYGSVQPQVMLFRDDDGGEEDVSNLTFRERFFYGGYLGLQIGNFVISVNVSPTLGFRFTNRLTIGLGGTYQYYRDRGWMRNVDFTTSTHIFGGSTYARYMVYRQIFVHGEFEALNLDPQMRFSPESGEGIEPGASRFWEYNYFAGGGYRQRLSDKVFLNLMVLYNFNTESVVYFQNPIFRFGIDVRM